MSGNQFGVVPKLPAQLTGTLPIVVTKSGLSYNISYLGQDVGLAMSQIFAQLAVADPTLAVAGNLPISPYAPINVALRAPTADIGGIVYAFIQTQLGLSSAAMAAFWAAAATQPVSP